MSLRMRTCPHCRKSSVPRLEGAATNRWTNTSCTYCGQRATASTLVNVWHSLFFGPAFLLGGAWIALIFRQEPVFAGLLALLLLAFLCIPALIFPLRGVFPEQHEHWRTTLRRWFSNPPPLRRNSNGDERNTF
jgi:hypothetical protein